MSDEKAQLLPEAVREQIAGGCPYCGRDALYVSALDDFVRCRACGAEIGGPPPASSAEPTNAELNLPIVRALLRTGGEEAVADHIGRLRVRRDDEYVRLIAEISMLRAQLRAAEDGRTVDRMNAEAAAQQERARSTLICRCGYAMLPMSTAEGVYGCTKCGNSVRLMASHSPPTPLANDGVWPCGCVYNRGEQIQVCMTHLLERTTPPTPEDR